MKRTNLQL